jgi:hypothetical protein
LTSGVGGSSAAPSPQHQHPGDWVLAGSQRKQTTFFVFVALSRPAGALRGAAEKKCTYVLYLARNELFFTCDTVIFFIAFLGPPYRKTPKNALNKIGKGKKQLDARPRKTFFITFLSSFHREALNQRNKTIERKKKELKNNTRKKFPPPKKHFPGVFFETYSIRFLVFSNSPCRETPKNAL